MPSISQMKRSRLAPIALTVALSVTLLTFSSASNAAVGTTLTEGMELSLYQLGTQTNPGGYIHASLNENGAFDVYVGDGDELNSGEGSVDLSVHTAHESESNDSYFHICMFFWGGV